MPQLVQGTYQWKEKRSQHIFSVTNHKTIPHNRQHKNVAFWWLICWCRILILTCIKSNGKSRLMIPTNTVQFTELENVTSEKKVVHPSTGILVCIKLIIKIIFTPWSVCTFVFLPTFLCSWNVHFWWHWGRDRWSHLLDWSRSGCGCWSGRLRGKSVACHGNWFCCHHWKNNPQTAAILHHKERNYFSRSSWDCSKSAITTFSSTDYSELQICYFCLQGLNTYQIKNFVLYTSWLIPFLCEMR